MGVLAALLVRGMAGEGARLFIGVGILGGFTTFSAFSLESVQLIEQGQLTLAELEELESFVRVNTFLGLLKVEAQAVTAAS